ncbi:hypothetical protein PIB30_099396, partial [Stylosanthes scabra]|nr:hypothetical protein [Stylosanthes scabra]
MRCGVVETSSPFKPSSDDGADNVDGMRCGRARTRRCGGMVSSEGDGREGGGVLWWPIVVVGKEGSDELRGVNSCSAPKKHPIQVPTKAAGEGTSKDTAKPIRIRSQRIARKGGTSTNAPKEKVIIAISSNFELELKLEDTIHEVVEMDSDQEKDPEEDPEE